MGSSAAEQEAMEKGLTISEKGTRVAGSSAVEGSAWAVAEKRLGSSAAEELREKGLTFSEIAMRVAGSSVVEEAREDEGHMARALKGLTQEISWLAKPKFGFDPFSDGCGDPPPTPFLPSEPSREEKDGKKRRVVVIQPEKRAYTYRYRKEKHHEESAELFPRRPVHQAMMYQRFPPRDASKKKNVPITVQPSTLPLPLAAQDASKEEKKTQVVIRPPFEEKALAAYLARRKKERETEPDESDLKAYEAGLYREFWMDMYAGEKNCGSYEDKTSIPPMTFTDKASMFAGMQPTLNVFSVKIEELTGGLSWPLDVYGVVAVRDVVDHNRNVIFYRERDNCQTITSKEPFLSLTGPTRAVVVTVHATYFEVDLKVKGSGECDDKDLSLLAVCYTSSGPCRSCCLTRVATSKLSTLRFNFGHIVNSVEATIRIDMLGGEWPRDYNKVAFTASTASLKGVDILLLTVGDGKLPVEEDGQVVLSRRVVCVELLPPEEGKLKPKLMVSVKIDGKNRKLVHGLSFKPRSRGRSHRTIKFESFEMKVTVAWSLLATFKCIYERAMSA